jgi:hypothetical protein
MTVSLGRTGALLLRFFALPPTNVSPTLDHGVRATKRTSASRLAHGLADAVRHEPSGLVGYVKHAVQLMRTHAFLGRGHQMERQNPLVQRDVRALKQRADRHRELLAAVAAVERPSSIALAFKALHVGRAAVRAPRTIGPAQLFQMLAGVVFVVKDRIGQVGHRIALDFRRQSYLIRLVPSSI